ncbi:M1 family metallopeptidase [Chryseobacterium sp. MFBS3-17]|uniref:M1 family metallopeptidase n=1 Tax=Chryseobacterium sp. MFBS3-17 TaxID=2886689 RepID=UPI001D0ED8FB|nr:M1 family metallopeptidase [Chryseobacterium sp. MFBS3-17]MCC2590485.1 M1 family metallopeptidase [Chryseobacterium sp. MFBS3-17]
MNKSLVLLFFLMAALGFAQQGPYYQQFAKYKMDIDVDAAGFTYNGKQTITYTNNSPDELKVVYFHLYWNAFKPGSMMDQRVASQGKNGDSRLQRNGISTLSTIPKDQEGAQNIHWIKQNDKDLKFEIQETIMKVELNTPLQPNTSTTFTMEWDAVIPEQIRRAGRNNREGIDMTMTQWYPKIAEYDYDGWATFDYIGREFHAPFADFEVNIKIDKDYIIGAGGTLMNENEVRGYSRNAVVKADDQNKATWRWTAKNILDFAWAADRDYTVETFTVPDGPKIYYVYQKSEKTSHWETSKPYVTKFFQLMNTDLGRYIYPSYAFVQGGDGGMEYGMATMMLGEGRTLEGLVGLMVHEGGHSYNQQILATNESMRPWLDEGFTSYYDSKIMHQLFPPEQPVPNPFMSSLQSYRNFTKRGLEEPAVWLGDHHDHGTAYSFATYVKGELYLVQLGYIMGEETLSLVMKEFYNQWKLKHPTDRDFLHIAQKISGMDLKWFHHYWINTTKTIDYAVKHVEHGENTTTITLQNKGDVPMPVDFSVLTRDKKLVHYQIPLNMTRTWKSEDIYGSFKTLAYWPWTQKEYTFTIPYGKDEISAMGIDFSQRLADVDPEDNILEIK